MLANNKHCVISINSKLSVGGGVGGAMNQLLVISCKEDTLSVDIGRKYLAGLRKKLKSARSKHWDVSIVFLYIKSISSVVPLPQRAVKQKGI